MTIKQYGGVFGRNPTFNKVEADDGIIATKSSGTPVVSNRTTNDGILFDGQRDGTSVFKAGSISGVASYLIIDPRTASGDGVGIRGANGNSSGFEAIWPTDGNGTASNGVLDLGNSSYRWKNGYFSGDINTSGGNLVVSNGKGIDFSATAGTGTSELLDDYEEGTWTPVITFGGASVGMTFSTQGGRYTKVGNLVTASCYIVLSAKGSSTGSAKIGGLPFSSLNETGVVTPASVWISGVTFADFPQANLSTNATSASIRESTNAGAMSDLTEANFANTSSIMLSIAYRA